MSKLFTPLRLGPLELPNRIIIAPMCQYGVNEGVASDWHRAHLGSLAMSGAGLLTIEATAVSAEGRITPRCLGLYSDENEAGLAAALAAIRSFSTIKIAIQLGHAGRKASSHTPFDGGAQIPAAEAEGWASVAPSAVPHSEDDEAPLALDEAGLERVKADFVSSARRAVRLGLDGIELHAAHGYLLHQFLSPLANRREDKYGGSLENRMRYPLEVFEAVRSAVPPEISVWPRLSATDWADGGLTLDEAIVVAKAFEAAGAAAIHVSSAGVSAAQDIPVGPGYQVHLATAIKDATEIPVMAVGLITEPDQAEDIVASGKADAVAMARAFLWNPRWPWHAAAALGADVEAPKQYWRSAPHGVQPPFIGFAHGQR